MGYPHKPHPKETAVLSRYFGDPDARSYKGWVKRGGYEAWKQAQTMGRGSRRRRWRPRPSLKR